MWHVSIFKALSQTPPPKKALGFKAGLRLSLYCTKKYEPSVVTTESALLFEYKKGIKSDTNTHEEEMHKILSHTCQAPSVTSALCTVSLCAPDTKR